MKNEDKNLLKVCHFILCHIFSRNKKKIVTMCALFTVLICNRWNASFHLARSGVACPRGSCFPHTHLSYCCIRPLWIIKNTLADANKQTHSFPYRLVTSDMFFIRSLYVLYLGEELHIWSVRYIFSFIFRWCIIEISIHTQHLWALTICLKHRNTVETLDCRDAAWAVDWWLRSKRERYLRAAAAIGQINILFW